MPSAISKTTALFLLLAAVTPIFAIVPKNLVVFGDSYSDVGNLQRQTNGPLWVEDVAYAWNVSVYNFAFGGATCDSDLYALDPSDKSPSLRDQIEIYYDQKLDLKPEETVYAIWIGINDVALATADNGAKPVPPNEIASCVRSQIATLRHYFKAVNILLLEVPPLEHMPFFYEQDQRGDASRRVNSLFVVQNADWSSELNIRLKIIYTHQLLDKVVAAPGSYGFNNVTHGYWEVCTGTCTDNENDYLWWDAGHLTGAGHKLIANEIIRASPFDVEAEEVDDVDYVKEALNEPATKLKSDVYQAKSATGTLDNAPEKENESTASSGGLQRPMSSSNSTWSRFYAIWILLLLIMTFFCCFSVGRARLTTIMASFTTKYNSRGRFVPLRDLESSRE
ncbi:SGNH hydrolase-type esterase domain-containing protein [Umbelopsis sp. AD052]|nr:SGNH hydrolase-type esterase domain-containing protein [Umbelopsis sp. AD052]